MVQANERKHKDFRVVVRPCHGPCPDSPGSESITPTLPCLAPAWEDTAAGAPPALLQSMRNLLTLSPVERNKATEVLWPAKVCRRLHHHSSSHPIPCTCVNNWAELDAAQILCGAVPAGGRAGRGEWRKETWKEWINVIIC